MINLFRKKAAPVIGQENSCIPAEKRKEKREYSFRLEFRCRGQLFADVESNTIADGIFRIGKSPECDLTIPATDRICGENHLELHISTRTLRLQAHAGNYFYCNGRKITTANLKKYDRIAFGDCELNVKEGLSSENSFSNVHRLEFTNGEKKGEMILLEKDLIRIGSDPENDIVLKEDVVSRFHAKLRITENGECWLEDLQSINGTTVNEVKLGTQERMLMDSDEISFASVTMLFLDKKVFHTRSQIGRKIVVMGITVLVIFLVFALFYAVTPHASQLLLAAEYYIARENFDTAQKMLDRMPHSREYNNFKEHHRIFTEKLDRYRNTLTIWEEFKKNLQKSKWNLAVGNYGMLEENNRSAWNWAEDSANRKMKELKYAKMLLNLHFDIQSLLYSTDLSLEQKKKKNAEVQKKELPALEKEIPWLVPLRKEIAVNTRKLEESAEVWLKAEKLLAQLSDADCSLDHIIKEMEKLHVISMGSVRTRIFDINDSLKQLRENDNVIQKNCKALRAMSLDNIEREISFVAQDECLINLHLIRKRSQLIERHWKVLEAADNISIQSRKLRKLGFTGNTLPEEIESLLTEKNFNSLFGKEILSSADLHFYDRFFGNRYFYHLMQESTILDQNIYPEELPPGMKKIPLCLKLNAIFKAAETTHLYLQTLKKEFLYGKNVKNFDNTCIRLLERRKFLLEFFRKQALDAGSNNIRSYFIARTAFFYFSTPGSIRKEDMKDFSVKWKKYQAEMQSHLNEYNPLDKVKMQQLLHKVQSCGIPGDPKMSWIRSQQ